MADIVLAVAVWCANPWSSRIFYQRTPTQVNECRDRIMKCIDASDSKKDQKQQIEACFKKEKL